MLFSIFYIISDILLFILFLFLKKTDKKQNLIKWIIVTFGLFFCYNSIVAYILNLLGIPIYLVSLAIVNVLICLLIFFFIKIKGRQKYYILKRDVAITIAITVIIFLIGLFRFGFSFNIVYETCDAGTHFWTAKDFFEQSYLLNSVTDKTIVNFETRQFASYVNLGIIFKIVAPFIDDFDIYKFYIIFDIFMLLLSSLMFYVLVDNEKKNIPFIIFFIGILLYIFGYPLNSMLFGFFYLGHSIMIITLMLYLHRLYEEKQFSSIVGNILLFITNLGLFFTYYFFVPVVYGSFIVYFIYKLFKNKEKVFTKNNILFLVFIYVVPCLLGFIYFILPNIGNTQQNFIYQMSLEGFCYIDTLNSFLLFIPIILIYIVGKFKKKKIDVEIFMYVILWLFILLFIFLILNFTTSTYYLSKPYYLLWLISFVIVFKFLYEINNSKKLDCYCYLGFVLFCVILSFANFKENLEEVTPNYTYSNYFDVFGIYQFNINKYLFPNVILTNDEMNDLKKLKNKGITNIYSSGSSYARLWMAAYFETDKIYYPENQLYTFVAKNYYANENEFEMLNLDQMVLFYRPSNSDYIKFSKDESSLVFDNYHQICSECSFEEYESFIYIKRK